MYNVEKYNPTPVWLLMLTAWRLSGSGNIWIITGDNLYCFLALLLNLKRMTNLNKSEAFKAPYFINIFTGRRHCHHYLHIKESSPMNQVLIVSLKILTEVFGFCSDISAYVLWTCFFEYLIVLLQVFSYATDFVNSERKTRIFKWTKRALKLHLLKRSVFCDYHT